MSSNKLEQGLRAAQVPLKASKEALKESDPAKWRGYLLGVWRRRQKRHPELRELYDSKLIIAQKLLEQWVTTHPDPKLPVTFDNWFTQPAFCFEEHPAAWRRATQAQSLWALGLFISAGLAQGQTLHDAMIPLLRAICRS